MSPSTFLIVFSAFCISASLSQNSLVRIRVADNSGRTLSESEVPATYLTSCSVSGNQLQPGQTITIQENNVPPCVLSGLQSYVRDLRVALQGAVDEIEASENEVSTASQNNIRLDAGPIVKLLQTTLSGSDGSYELLDITQTINTLQPVIASVGSTLRDVETVLTTVTSGLHTIGAGLTTLLGSTLGVVDNTLSGVGSLVGGLGNGLEVGGEAIFTLVDTVAAPVAQIVDNLGRGLQNLDVNELLNGRR